jgi:pyruvate formate lyase activating enzyme
LIAVNGIVNVLVAATGTVVPTVNDDEHQILRLKAIADQHRCVDKVELLPFRKICQVKYDSMGISFPFGHLPEPTTEDMRRLENLL